MRKGRRIGYYEMAEDRFFNESSERNFLHDDMMDAVSELITGTIGNAYSRVDDWVDLYREPDEIVQKRKISAKNRGTRQSIKSKLHKFLEIATEVEISTFIDKYILRLDDDDILVLYGHDRVPGSPLNSTNTIGNNIGLIELFANISNPEIIKIKTVYDLEKILDADDYITLVNVHVHRNDIRGLEKFRQDIYNIAYNLCPYRSASRVVFESILEKLPHYLKQISMDMYKEYCDIIQYNNITICEFCDFICKSMKYKWLPLSVQEVTLCRSFSIGTMGLFDNLKPGNIFIRGLDVASVLDKDATIALLTHDILEKNSSRSHDMFCIYDTIHSALDPDYVRSGSKSIEDIYGIGQDSLQCYDAMIKQAIETTDFTLALNRYLKSIGRDSKISKLNIHIADFDNLLSKSYSLHTEKDYRVLLDLMITLDPKYLAELKVEKDIRILITVFYNLVKICKIDHSLYKNINPLNSFNVLLGISMLRFVYDSTPYWIPRGEIENVLLGSINNTIGNYREIIIRLMNSLKTKNFSIIDDDLAIIKKYYCTNK